MKGFLITILCLIISVVGFFVTSLCLANFNDRSLKEEWESWKPVQEETVETEEVEDSDEIIVEDEATNEAM